MSKQHGVAATAGHLENNGGLRGHSVGDAFPWIVVGIGNPHDDSFGWVVQDPRGGRSVTYTYAALAEVIAECCKMDGTYFPNHMGCITCS